MKPTVRRARAVLSRSASPAAIAVRSALVVAATVVSPLAAAAQEPPSVVTHATGQVDVAPDHAVVSVGAMFRAPSATAATERLAATLEAILDALVAMGFDRDSVPTSNFSVNSLIDYDRDTVMGYDARGDVTVTIRDLTRAGAVVDAVVAAGANQLGALDFRVDDTRAARDSALALAVAAARRDADVLARAAGGRIGELVEITTMPQPMTGGVFRMEEMVMASARGQAGGMPVTPRMVTIQVSVSGRWRFSGS